jgi:hypothetical protein
MRVTEMGYAPVLVSSGTIACGRRKLGLDVAEHPMMLVELRDGGIFLQPAEAVPVREIPEEILRSWIKEDERDAESFWEKPGKA